MALTVGVLSGYLAGAYEGPVISAVLRAVSEREGRVVAVQTAGPGTDYHQGIILKDLAHVGWDQLSGLVTIANAVQVDYLQAFRATGKPVVAISNEEAGFACPTVLAANGVGVTRAVEHLVGHGHTRIGFVGCLDQFDQRERYEAYRATLLSHGLEPDPKLFYEADNNFEHGAKRAAQAMLEAGLPSTAIVAATDMNAIAVMRALKAAGYRLPEDQAIVGFDDKPDCSLVSPSLSTVSQDLDRLGTLAAELLLRQLDGETVADGRYLVPTAYIVRESCGCAGGETSPEHGAPGTRGKATGGRATRGPGRDGAVAVFTQSVGGANRPDVARSAGVAWLASEIEEIYRQALTIDPSARQLLRLSQICEDLYAQDPSRTTYDAILAFSVSLASELEASAATAPPGVAERLAQCSSQVRLSLTKALLDVRNNSYYELRQALRDEYQITLDLFNNRERDPRQLGWLRVTGARVGVLGVWEGVPGAATDRGPERPLEIVGTYDSLGNELDLASSSIPVGSFPPEELFGDAYEVRLVCVFPVRSPGTDWGFLAIAQVGAQLEQEAYFTWSALFSEALDHRALLHSLRQRGEDLALSYQREREMANAVRESEERYALASRAANDGLWDWDLTLGTCYFSSRWKQMLGFGENEIGDVPAEWLDRVHLDDRPLLLAELAAMKRGERSSVLNEHRVRARDGNYVWVLCRGLAVPGLGAPASRIVGSLTDIAERRSLEERLRQQALYDSLTGLPNRALFLDRLSQTMATIKRRPGARFAVLWFDLDDFKGLNDTLGHMYGDKLLVQFAGRVRSQVRDTDTAARFGGDEFVVLLQDADRAAIGSVLRRLSESLNEPYDLDGQVVTVTASIGVAVCSPDYERPEEILRDADIAMYRAKSEGWGKFVMFEPSMTDPSATRRKGQPAGPKKVRPKGPRPERAPARR